jgi:acetoin utilization protein AcuB
MQMPAISRYMTKQPVTIDRSTTLAEAHRIMREHDIRHLPVLEEGRLTGIVTQRDLHLLETIGDLDLDGILVDEAMTDHPFIVTGDTGVDEVAEIMADHKYGSVIVVGRDGVEGIFTAVDACRVLADVLRRAEVESLGESKPA